MAWTFTDDVSAFQEAAGPFLTQDPERHTVLLSLLARLRRLGPTAFGTGAPLLGWWSSGGRAVLTGGTNPPEPPVRAAVLQTPPRPMLITPLPGTSADELAAALADSHAVPQVVNGAEADAVAFARACAALTGQGLAGHGLAGHGLAGHGLAGHGLTEHGLAGDGPGQGYQVLQRQRLHRLGTLTPPDPAPVGEARVATGADVAYVNAWYQEFAVEASGEAGPPEGLVRDRIDTGQILLWQVAREPVSMAGVSEALAGVARVAPVYTPAGWRGRGYGGAVTAAASRLALDRGASSVVLFTDLANPISNALYLKLGYLAVEDRVVLGLRGPR